MERVSAKLLHDLWRVGARVEPEPLRRDGGAIGLYRSPCGLMFFHPAVAGSAAFYRAFYERFRGHEMLGRQAAAREDFRAGAALARPGDRVLDVGCGAGAFAALLPTGARYTGLEPHGTPRASPPVLAETAEAHARRFLGAYELVCAFQVLEHAADPLGLASAMVECLAPGGLLVLAMPIWPSPHTEIPNNLVNLPPHHLTWWNEGACRALVSRLGLEAVRVEALPAYPSQAPVHWTRALCLTRTRPGRYVRAGWRCHAAVALAYGMAKLLAPLAGLPPRARPLDILVVARKPTQTSMVAGT
ncbi:MAG: methyltransferase domain-containing protein [Acetobacteraceae bacterium]|nr:methyltransferase domain-containing protein [Acetobacteraceae bacterium]